MKFRNWAGTKVNLSGESLFAEMKYYFFKMPKEKILPQTAIRPMFSYIKMNQLLSLLGPLTGVEIGVHVARNSYNIFQSIPIKHLYLIDPYSEYEQGGGIANSETDTDFIERTAHHRMKEFDGRVTWIKKCSGEAADFVPNDLDFVYIDGNHDYEYVKEDIELYYPKVHSGGVVGGNDFEGGYLGVIKAVFEFCNKNNLPLLSGGPDWWVVK